VSKPGGMSLTRYGRALLPILLAILLALGLGAALTFHLARGVTRNTQAILHAHAVVDKARAALAQTERSEAAQRTHVVGGDAAALSAFAAAARAATDMAEELKVLTLASPRQRARSDYIRAQITVRLELLQRGVDAAKAQGFGPQHAAPSGDGQELMAVIRNTVDAIVADENAALVRRIEASAAAERSTIRIAVAAVLGSFIALMLAALLVARRVRQIRTGRRAAAARAAALQKTLDHAHDGIAAFDAERRLIAFNPRFFRLMQLPEDLAVLGTPAAELCRNEPLRGSPELQAALFNHPDPSAGPSIVPLADRRLEVWQSRAIDGSLIVSCRALAPARG
jgi:CHASE3 domain sensor protein